MARMLRVEPGKRRQRARQIGVEIGLPQPHEPRELLARRRGLLAWRRQARASISVANTCAARLVELVHRAGLLELVRRAPPRPRRFALASPSAATICARRDRAHISPPRLGRDPQGLLRGAELGLLRIRSAAILVRAGMVSERQQAADDLPLDVELDRGRDIGEGEAQGRWPARLARRAPRRCRAGYRRLAGRDC